MNCRGIDEGDYFHSKRQLLRVRGSRIGAAAGRGFHLQVLNADVGKGILEIGQEFAEVVEVGGAANVEQGRAIGKLWQHTYFGRNLAAELRDLNFAIGAKLIDRGD